MLEDHLFSHNFSVEQIIFYKAIIPFQIKFDDLIKLSENNVL